MTRIIIAIPEILTLGGILLLHDPPPWNIHSLEFGTSFRRVGGKQNKSTNTTPCTLTNAVLDDAFKVDLRVYVHT